jgi:hypothetical protein
LGEDPDEIAQPDRVFHSITDFIHRLPPIDTDCPEPERDLIHRFTPIGTDSDPERETRKASVKIGG